MLIKTARNKRSGGCILQIFIIEIQFKRDIYFLFDVECYSTHFDIVR